MILDRFASATTGSTALNIAPGIPAQSYALATSFKLQTTVAIEQEQWDYSPAFRPSIAIAAFKAAAVTCTITPATLPGGIVGTVYSGATIATSNCTTPVFSVVSGLPPGLTIGSSTGVISGNPTRLEFCTFWAGWWSRRSGFRVVIYIQFDFFDAGLGARVIRCGLPRAIEQFHLAEILYCQAAPVIRCTRGLETTFAVASVLVAQHLEPSMSVPAQ